MNANIVLPVLFLIAVVMLGRFLRFRPEHAASGLHHIAETKFIFLFLGIILGPSITGIVTPEIHTQLSPLLGMGLGLIGFLYGTSLDLSILIRLRKRVIVGTFFEAVVTFLIVLAAVRPALHYILPATTGSSEIWVISMILAVTAAGTAPAAIFVLRTHFFLGGPHYECLQFISAVDDIPGCLILLGCYSFLHPGLLLQSDSMSGFYWLIVSLLTGTLAGLLLGLFARIGLGRNDLNLVIFGIIGFSAGTSEYLHLSPFLVTLVAGLVYANTCRRIHQVYRQIEAWEHVLYVLFLIMAGTLFQLDKAYLSILLPIYIGSRFAGKILGGACFFYSVRSVLSIRRSIGLGLLPQGGLAIAMIVDFYRLYSFPASSDLLAVVILSILFTEFFAPRMALRIVEEVGPK